VNRLRGCKSVDQRHVACVPISQVREWRVVTRLGVSTSVSEVGIGIKEIGLAVLGCWGEVNEEEGKRLNA
jgi:hypothetical protein